MLDEYPDEIMEEALAKERNLLRTLINNLPNCHIFVKNTKSQFITTNTAHLQTLGAKTQKEVIGKTDFAFFPKELAEQYYADEQSIIQTGKPILNQEELVIDRAGRRKWVLTTKVPLHDSDGSIVGLVGMSSDITERKRAEWKMRDLLRLHQTTLATIPSSLVVLDGDLNIIMANERYMEEQGIQSHEVIGRNIADVFPASLLQEQSLLDRIRAVSASGGQDEILGIKHESNDREKKYLDIRICGILPSEEGEETRVLLVIDDTTERRILEEQLRQSQKIEAIGILAGGVAHDFNNFLTGIVGYAQMALGNLPVEEPTARVLTRIIELARRAAALTRQLLAFSRRQTLNPVVLDINSLVENTSKMLQRIIGEDIDLKFIAAPNLGSVRADAGQIEQVLMNLAVNARDAMPNGGKLIIETANVTLDQDYAKKHIAVKPGRYVMLAITDNGRGMDKATRERIFEPFFTTKEAGKGTGLGLSTVYGIVKQHNGNIWVYSEPGKGTTFKVYLPCVDDKAEELQLKPEPEFAPRGSETILVVEDEESVRDTVRHVLETQGYTVISAAFPEEAEEFFAKHDGDIALLLTDVVMPGYSGRELYEHLTKNHPNLKVLYMSGYTDDAIVHHGVLEPGTPFIQKPFDPPTLARKLREVLDKSSDSPACGRIQEGDV